MPETTSPTAPVAQWYLKLDAAVSRIREVTPEHSSIILVHENSWGPAEARLAPRRVLPFLERAGLYWGLPSDDATAVAELQRMRDEGATHIAFAWPCFWWLDHYAGLAHYLRARAHCVVDDDNLKILQF
jgi:hypothetical protein